MNLFQRTMGQFASIRVTTEGLNLEIGIEDERDFEILGKALEKVRRNMAKPPPGSSGPPTGMAPN